MLIILNDPTPNELAFVKKLMQETDQNRIRPTSELQTLKPQQEWINPQQFVAELEKKGYKCSTSKTRKKLCLEHGIQYEKRGKELWFRNQLDRIPNRIVTGTDAQDETSI